MPTRKISITVDAEILDEVRRRVGERGLSRFFSDAVANELRRESLAALVAELDAEYGPPNLEYVAEAQAALKELAASKRKRKQTSA